MILAVLAARRLSVVLPPRPGLRRLAAVALVGIAVVYAFSYQDPESVILELTQLHSTYVDRWGSAGLWLRENAPPGTVTAVKGAGAIAYYSRLPILDAYGLNDLHIAHTPAEMGTHEAGHEKQDPQYVLDRRPAYILELDTYLSPVVATLQRDYTPVTVRTPTGLTIQWWQRRGPALAGAAGP